MCMFWPALYALALVLQGTAAPSVGSDVYTLTLYLHCTAALCVCSGLLCMP